ncbi:hypothetical protein [Wolbachia endosymbiont of Chironomus riparius]|uniref:hypothetical protein n=1 Tax=Wolbachia endosymbiont of Chironomus riparius TaxID=2883238 RepID=UPI00209DC35A|nr:hypothetical protein [Wolbachia endosymbiont of Chironomus riparius]
MSKLSNEAPIILTWVPKVKGATVSQENLNIIKKYVKLCEKDDERKIYLVLNGPGFENAQIEEINQYLQKQHISKVDVINLHDYDWSKIDAGWKIDSEDINIKEYYRDFYNMSDKKRTCFPVEIDTFRVIALALSDQITGQDIGAIYIDFDILGTMKKPTGRDIETHYEIALGEKYNNDLIVVTNSSVANKIMACYKEKLLTQEKMVSKIKESIQDDGFVSDLGRPLFRLSGLQLRRIFDNANKEDVSMLLYTEIFSITQANEMNYALVHTVSYASQLIVNEIYENNPKISQSAALELYNNSSEMLISRDKIDYQEGIRTCSWSSRSIRNDKKY